MNEHQLEKSSSIDLENLKALSVLGRGAKGVVFLVQEISSSSFTEETLALKVISKSYIESKKKNSNQKENGEEDVYRRIWFERDVLKLFNHPLLPKLKGVIVNDEIVGFAIDYCVGGDLNSLRKRQTEKMFSDDIIRFYAAELVLALEYLHGLGIIYRDLKPENVMIQENGHLMIVDFDLSTKLSSKSDKTQKSQYKTQKSQSQSSITKSISAKKNRKKLFPTFCLCNSGITPVESVARSNTRVNSVRSDSEKSNSFVGTEEYVAPEIIIGNGHDFSVDWWGLGVVLYEMLYGATPFRGINRKETFYRILTKTPELVGDQTALRDLIGKLLEKDPTKRISLGEIKNHEFFRGLDWDTILQISRPPYIPSPVILEENEEDMKGNKGIDVKTFVHVVFNGADVEKDENNKNKDQWVEGLSNPITNKTDDFLVF
ncbi:Protein kinase domain [Macleaya cordata]|uniref:non-specific serine/threonine protein kinase n=1 Tax=Macleaya cordata TaxID=56857 RepID=A0A200R8N9_MACCD|nr:Protein kinase domain [Macleaya cordata]